MSRDIFQRELCALLAELEDPEIRLIVGGGYGLVLRQQRLRALGIPTLLRPYPAARSTQDIDIFLTGELLVDADRVERFRGALDALGYRPVEAAKYYQFVRDVDYEGQTRSLKIDLLAGSPRLEEEKRVLKADARRVRNRAFRLLHAHVAPEAVTVEEHLLPVKVQWEDQAATVYVPHPFSYLLLKLFALRDQLHREEKRYGRHHAFDLYTSIAMMTEGEWEQACELRDAYASEPPVLEAGEIAVGLFASPVPMGMVRLREHLRETGETIREDHFERFAADMSELFPVS